MFSEYRLQIHGFQELKASSVSDVCQYLQNNTSEGEIILVKANANVLRECKTCKDAISAEFSIPQFWWGVEMKRANGFFGSEEEWTEDGGLTAYRTWCRFMAKYSNNANIYKWVKVNLFTRTEFKTKRTFILSFETSNVIDLSGDYNKLSEEEKNGQCNRSLQEQLLIGLTKNDLADPYWMYRPILQSFMYIQERAIWKVRDLVRACESDARNQGDSSHDRANFAEMHVISRHSIHVNETILLTVQSLQQIIEKHSDFYRLLASMSIRDDGMYVLQNNDDFGLKAHQKILQSRVRSALKNHYNAFSALSLRANATQQRLQSEIQLAFNVTTQVDSRAMRNISLLTMVFLPSTFVATIFSTTFFSVDNNQWMMNDKFWMFWAFAIPVTVLVMLWWYFIQERQLSTSAILGIDQRRQKKAQAKEEQGREMKRERERRSMQLNGPSSALHMIKSQCWSKDEARLPM
ncbi:hypothetical protein TD95_003709 [Thielaviopsis punctulata]|uniref:Mg2+ transporter protein, CorA-like/Zinc transport protein ZntB n=1 Tax=Thielaviopsis punctulata TaxID=72032 RepID=A0A0F4ZG52_9PEZI|nr:hypothetical protein TD95_003709 [Thielaviopsis punctulata]